jgi:hypothetical protein
MDLLQITYEVFFSQPNSFLAKILDYQFKSSVSKLISRQADTLKLNSLHSVLLKTTLHGSWRKHSLYC